MTEVVTAEPTTAGDRNIQLPPVVLHFAPVFIAVFCLWAALIGSSIYRSFDDHRGAPGTMLSLCLMTSCLLLVLPAVLCESLDRPRRILAGLLSVVAGIAILDEKGQGHESVGKYLQHNVTSVNKLWLHYSDDLLIVLATLVVGGTLCVCLRKCRATRDVWRHVWPVLLIGLGQGLMDVAAHRTYLWELFWPDLTYSHVWSQFEVLGFFEEWMKIWTEWFVLLLLLRFFHGQRGPLGWSLAVFAGGMLTTLGVWQVADPTIGMPGLVVHGDWESIRNFNLFTVAAWIWIAWSVAAWRLWRDRPPQQWQAGLFYLSPLWILLPHVLAQQTFFRLFDSLAEVVRPHLAFGPDFLTTWFLLALVLVPGIALGFASAWLLRSYAGTVAGSVVGLVTLVALSCRAIGVDLLPLTLTCGVLFPALLLSLPHSQRRLAWTGAALLCSTLLLHSAAWDFWVLAAVVALCLSVDGDRRAQWSPALWTVLLVAHVALGAAATVAEQPVFLKNYHRPPSVDGLPVLKVYYRRDPRSALQ